MPNYDVEITFSFYGVEADSRDQARELCDNAVGEVIVTHPNDAETKVASDCRIDETT